MRNFLKNLFYMLLIFIVIIMIAIIGILAYQVFVDDGSEEEVLASLQDKVYTLIEKKEENIAVIEPILGDTTNNVQNENKIKYFYNQLDDNAKLIYNAIEKEKDNMDSGNREIPLPSSLGKLYEYENGEALVNQTYQNAIDAFRMDYVDLFYVDTTKLYLMTTITTRALKKTYNIKLAKGENVENYFLDNFLEKEDVKEAIEYVKGMAEAFKQSTTGSEYEQIKFVHDWLVNSVEYDQTLSKKNNANIYGTLKDKEAICEGYARTFKYILDKLEIPCVLVSGIGTDKEGKSERHMWNYVLLEGNWYAVDCTWDDPIVTGGKQTNKMKYQYFLKGAESFQKDHREDGNVSIQGKKFEYPNLSIQDYAT